MQNFQERDTVEPESRGVSGSRGGEERWGGEDDSGGGEVLFGAVAVSWD